MARNIDILMQVKQVNARRVSGSVSIRRWWWSFL